MYECMYVCMYVCMHVCMYVCIICACLTDKYELNCNWAFVAVFPIFNKITAVKIKLKNDNKRRSISNMKTIKR